MTLDWRDDPTPAAWLAGRIHGFARDVGSIVPHGFEAYARVFHPLHDGPFRRWSDLAAHNGRIAHAEMQYHLVASRPGKPPERRPLSGEMDVGSLPEAELATLVEILRSHTPDPADVWFAVWEGYGQLHGASVPAVFELPNRSYRLLHDALDGERSMHSLLGRQSPNLWWPSDRSWCVATEIDFGWTYVGGSQPLITDVLESSALEALRASVSDGVAIDSDAVNEALDHEAGG